MLARYGLPLVVRGAGERIGLAVQFAAFGILGFIPTELVRDFDGPVPLLQGDSHRFTLDTPIAAAPNLTRVIVEGETVGEWLRLEIDDDTPGVFTVAREGVG